MKKLLALLLLSPLVASQGPDGDGYSPEKYKENFEVLKKKYIQSANKAKCRELGFKDNTDNMTLCLEVGADKIQRENDFKKASEALYQKVRDKKAKVALASKKSKCLQYGFKDNTDGMGLCLIELDKLDAIKNQATAANLAQSNLIARQQAEAKKQRQAQALINLGAMIGGAGVPTTRKSKPVNSSYPNSYTSSRTVPSNQNCPLLSIPLKKQEVKNGNRICYY